MRGSVIARGAAWTDEARHLARAHIQQKLGGSTRAELVCHALDHGLLDDADAWPVSARRPD
jgi:hypothetical protein